MLEPEPRIDAIVAKLMAGTSSPAVALAELVVALGDARAVAVRVSSWRRRELAPVERDRLRRLESLLRQHEPACQRIAAMLALERRAEDRGVELYRRLFDAWVDCSEEASVAAYSLGDPALLAQATEEVVALLRSVGLARPDAAVLQIGCGIGRFEQALSPYVREAHGVDVSERMIAAAKRRCSGLANLHFSVGSGRDLAGLPSCHFDWVYAVDSMPYVVNAGPEVVEAYFAEAARVLLPGGGLLILNFSYRGEPARDDSDVRGLAERHGYDVLVCGAMPFSFWNGREYLLTRPDRADGARLGTAHAERAP